MLLVAIAGWASAFGQLSDPEVPGDHFSLEGALELFKKSGSPEEFERLLNSPDSKVNNLDLDGDGYIDYIKVIDRYEGNVHAFILQAVISDREYQDVAVIELEKLGNGKAILQIIGDADVYGVETIIEPTREVRTYAGATTTRTVVNVWAWPSVQYVYSPYYEVWVSPWAWHVHPRWWRPWRPVTYVHYYSYWRPYRPYYDYCHSHRVVYAHRIYQPYRTTSVVVSDRHRDQITRYRSSRDNEYRSGRTRSDDGRSYVRDDRSSPSRTSDAPQRSRESSYVNRRPSIERNDVTSSRRSLMNSGGSVRTDDQRKSSELRRSADVPDRPSYTAPVDREVRRSATNPSLNRSRSYEAPGGVQRPATRERAVTPDIQRTPAPPARTYRAPESRSEAVRSSRQHSPQVTSPPARRSDSPSGRSSSVQGSREYRPQPSSPGVNRSRSTGGVSGHQRTSAPGSTRSVDMKRGRP